MDLGIVGQAVGLFAVTNIDDLVVLALFFAQGADHRGSARRVVLGQYLGFAAILAVAVAAAFGATFLPETALPYLGLLPLALGLKAAWRAWRDRRYGGPEEEDERSGAGGPGPLEVAAVTFANGGDNIGVYVPVFATAGTGGMSVYAVVFLALVGCGAPPAGTSPPAPSSPRPSPGGDTSCCPWCWSPSACSSSSRAAPSACETPGAAGPFGGARPRQLSAAVSRGRAVRTPCGRWAPGPPSAAVRGSRSRRRSGAGTRSARSTPG